MPLPQAGRPRVVHSSPWCGWRRSPGQGSPASHPAGVHSWVRLSSVKPSHGAYMTVQGLPAVLSQCGDAGSVWVRVFLLRAVPRMGTHYTCNSEGADTHMWLRGRKKGVALCPEQQAGGRIGRGEVLWPRLLLCRPGRSSLPLFTSPGVSRWKLGATTDIRRGGRASILGEKTVLQCQGGESARVQDATSIPAVAERRRISLGDP